MRIDAVRRRRWRIALIDAGDLPLLASRNSDFRQVFPAVSCERDQAVVAAGPNDSFLLGLTR